MTPEILQQYWAPILGSFLFFTILFYVLIKKLQGTRGFRLTRAVNHLRNREAAHSASVKAQEKARSKLEKLQARGDSVPPAKVLEAKDRLRAAEETTRLLSEQVQVVRNNARTIILEEYPPKRHAAMLKKHLGETK